MIQLNVEEGIPEGTYKVVNVIGCVLEREALFCASHVLSREFRILVVCPIREENRREVKAGRWDIYTRVPAICWFNLFCLLTNTKRPSHHLAEPPGTSLMRSIGTRFSTRGDGSLRRRALLWHLIPLLPLRPRASRSKLSSYLVVPTVQPSNTATNA